MSVYSVGGAIGMTPFIFAAILNRRERKDWTRSVGEDAVSNEFIKRHYAGLYSLLQRHIRDATVAEEMLNEAVATAIAHSRAGRVADPARLAGYVYRVAMNLYRNYRREFANRADLRTAENDIEQIPAQHSTDEAALDGSILRQILSIIASLPTVRDREIVKRFYLDEEDKTEICRSLGLSPLHFDRVVFRARQRLRSLLEAKGFDKSDFFGVLYVIGASLLGS